MALARTRRTRIDQLAEEGNKQAKLVQRYLDEPDRYISACQFGITLATLLLGAVGESAFAEELAQGVRYLGTSLNLAIPVTAGAAAMAYFFAFILTAFILTIFGELMPKTWAFPQAEKVILDLIYPMDFWCHLTDAFIRLLNGATNFLLKKAGGDEIPVRGLAHSEEELKMLVSASHEEGVLKPEEEEMVHSVFDFSDTVASEVMTPRTDMICVPDTATVKAFVDIALENGHSRIPIYEKDLDNIFGFLHIRDGLKALREDKDNTAVKEFARKVMIVPENKNILDLLTDFKKKKTHVAIIVDEYGATRGMVTLEDLLEELVGDIADESDIVEEFIQYMEDGSVILDGKLELYEANEKLNLEIEDEEFNTMGGHVFGLLGHEPQPGDEVSTTRYILRVEESDRHRIMKLRLIPLQPLLSEENEQNGANPSEEAAAKQNGANVKNSPPPKREPAALKKEAAMKKEAKKDEGGKKGNGSSKNKSNTVEAG